MNKTFNGIKVMAEAAKVFMDTLETQEQKDAFREFVLAMAQAINTARNESIAVAERVDKYCTSNVLRVLDYDREIMQNYIEKNNNTIDKETIKETLE